MAYTLHLSAFQSAFSTFAAINLALAAFASARAGAVAENLGRLKPLSRDFALLVEDLEAARDDPRHAQHAEFVADRLATAKGRASALALKTYQIQVAAIEPFEETIPTMGFLKVGLLSGAMLLLCTIVPDVTHLDTTGYDLLKSLMVASMMLAGLPIALVAGDLFKAVEAMRRVLGNAVSEQREAFDRMQAEAHDLLPGAIRVPSSGGYLRPLRYSARRPPPAVPQSEADRAISESMERDERVHRWRRAIPILLARWIVPVGLVAMSAFAVVMLVFRELARHWRG